MNILLTNDDGIYAKGIRALYKALIKAGHEVTVIAPLSEKSGVSSSVTLIMPLRVRQIEEENFSGLGVFGTPADCVKLGLSSLMEKKPDLVMSGINAGGNTGVDVIYSGTVAAALEGALSGYPAMAVSFDDFRINDISKEADHAVSLAEKIDWKAIPERRVINVNYPKCGIDASKGMEICPPATIPWDDKYEERRDIRGLPYWWISGYMPSDKLSPNSDRALLNNGYITVSPIRFEFVDSKTEEILAKNLNV